MVETAIRKGSLDDVEGAFTVLDLCQREGGESGWTLDHLRNRWQIACPRWVAEAERSIVAYAELGREGFDLAVRPDARRRGIGTRLLEEIEGAASDRDALRTGTYRDVPGGPEFLVEKGFVKAWDAWKMGMELARVLQEPRWPERVAVRTFHDEDAEEVKALLDLAYAEEEFHVPGSLESWRQAMLGDPSFDPEYWFLAEAGGEIIGAALNWGSEGFVKDLVVHPEHRRRGLGEALLRHSFREFRRRGLDHVSLKTDSINPTQAWRLYQRLGMEVEVAYEIYEKRLSS